MGQGQSQPQAAQRAPEPEMSEEERAQVQADVWERIKSTGFRMLT